MMYVEYQLSDSVFVLMGSHGDCRGSSPGLSSECQKVGAAATAMTLSQGNDCTRGGGSRYIYTF